MLHEILLSLSGHPSALFDAQNASKHVTSTPVARLSPQEAELLSSLAHLSRLHRKIRDHAQKIAANHPSTACRAVATAISNHHLAKFQKKVLEVEAKVLRRDAETVGAYNIVPLALVVNEFSQWTRVMEWLWETSNFILSSDSSHMVNGSERAGKREATGAELIDKLRTEAQTGYPDIAEAALHHGKVAETSWLRQLSTWLLYGRLPSFGASDFFISTEEEDDEVSFAANSKLLPKFVTSQTAASILFVGKSLNQIKSLESASDSLSIRSRSKSSELDLLPVHVELLSAISTPILSAKLSEAVSNIRLSLSRNLLQHLLPSEKIVETLTVFHQFFLLGRGEFPIALIAEADEKLQSRYRTMPSKKSGLSVIRGVLLKENEINQALQKSFSVLASLGGDDDNTDDILDLATDILHLTVHTSTSSHRPGTPGRAKEAASVLPILSPVVFGDFLLSIPTSLTMDVRSPLDLFLAKQDLDIYSHINAFLLASRRAHLHLSNLWKNSNIRREHPAPPGYAFSNSDFGKTLLKRRRQRGNKRSKEMRKVWATCAAAIFLLGESEAYFQGEVVEQSYKHFLAWIGASERDESDEDLRSSMRSTASRPSTETSEGRRQHDPESLSSSHRAFLSTLCHSLLLTDTSYTSALRSFFSHIDELVAFVVRLQNIQQQLDLEEDDGVEDHLKNFRQEEADVSKELDRSRRRLDSDMKSLIGRLRDLDAERGGGTGVGLIGSGAVSESAGGLRHKKATYEPLRVGGTDRLLMKLDWGEVDSDAEDSA
ncbi:Spc98 family protein [Lophiotrema nucula]|uniref:Spindle pole body component n=1 Tax=Lophiotrema nucula TaxID=690887 RepID=A0A6A5ZSV0_9PLEO|nr:Spc98 family protein [Lophiotrema nucula]